MEQKQTNKTIVIKKRRKKNKLKAEEEDDEDNLNLDKKKEFIADLKSTFKEFIFGLLILGILLLILTAYTWQWPPIVIIESESMMHGYDSKVGNMDTGDLVLSKNINNDRSLITTYVEGEKIGYRTFNSYGDVISFYKNGDSGTPVIHRALVWVEYNASGQNQVPGCQHLGSFDVPSLKIYNEIEFTLNYEFTQYDLTINLYKILLQFSRTNREPHSGFITKGDNNLNIDQGSLKDSEGQLLEPIKEDWVIGKAEGEVPWLGLVKLLITGQYKEEGSEPPKTSINMFVMCILLIIFCLMLVHFSYLHRERKKRRKKEREEDAKAEMFQKLIDNKRKSPQRGVSGLITKQELQNFSENELLKYLENIVGTGSEDKDTYSRSLTIYDIKELTQQADKNQIKAQLRERFTHKPEATLVDHEPSKSYLATLSKPIQTFTRVSPLTKQVSKEDMMEIFNLLLELEFDSNIKVFDKPIAPMARPAVSQKKVHGAPLAPIAKPTAKSAIAPIAKPVNKITATPMAKPIARQVTTQNNNKKPAPLAKPAQKVQLSDLMDRLK